MRRGETFAFVRGVPRLGLLMLVLVLVLVLAGAFFAAAFLGAARLDGAFVFLAGGCFAGADFLAALAGAFFAAGAAPVSTPRN